MNIRLLRGQVVIREDQGAHTAHYTHIVVPNVDTRAAQREKNWHMGTVLAKGPPALDRFGNEVPQGFEVGDMVLFHWNHHERAFTREWGDGKLAAWVPQNCVDAVVTKEDVN